MSRDTVYGMRRPLVDFAFDETVAAVFPDMIRRSVPGYETVIALSGLLAARHAVPGLRCYDLGCALGATALAITRALTAPDVRVVGIDNAPAMLAKARTLLASEPIEWVEADISEAALDDACVVVLNYTLQFVPPAERSPLLRRIREALHPDGALIVSEKIRFDDPHTQRELEAAHLDFKRANGYSELEISQKRSALENVLKPDTLERHRARFVEAGFGRATEWFRCLNWASFLARP